MRPQRLIAAVHWMIALGALGAIVLTYYRWLHVNTTTVALTLVLYVLWLAAWLGLRYAVGAALLGTACYNFYFLPPVGTFTVADPQNWLALFTLLATGILGSRLSQQARDEAERARVRQHEVEVLLALSRELLANDRVADLTATLPALLLRVSGSTSVRLFLLEDDRLYSAGAASDVADAAGQRQFALSLPDVQTDAGATVRIPLRTGVRPRGLLTLADLRLSLESCRAIGSLVSIALDRVQALEDAARGEATRESERLRTLMIDSITHELRTPLTAIKGAATTLLEDPGANSDVRQELLSIVDEEADRLNRLVGRAVEMAQLEACEVQMNFRRVSLAEVIEAARQRCAPQLARRSVTVDLPSLPPVVADAEMVEKVLCNLVENALKYSADGTPVFITASVSGETVMVSVADRGIGIDPAEQELIFHRLYRAPGSAGSVSGTGMGLAISRSIVAAHHGRLTVSSQLGRGSVFTFGLQAAV